MVKKVFVSAAIALAAAACQTQQNQPQPDVWSANYTVAFDVMVGAGSVLALLSAWFVLGWLRRHDMPRSRWFLRACAPAGVLAFAALEAGWVLTEVGRQPWVVYGVLRTADAVTHAPGIWYSFATSRTSGKLTAAASTRTRTSPGPSAGDESSSTATTSGGPYARQIAARISPHLPRQTGVRFSRKASGPSWASRERYTGSQISSARS